MKVGEGLLKFVGDDAVDVQVEPLEECPVEVAPDVVGAGLVQRPRIGQEVESAFEDLDPYREFGVRRGETRLDCRPISVDFAKPVFDLGLRQRSVGGQVEQTFFLGVEVLELLGHGAVHLADAGLLVRQDLVQELMGGRPELFGDAQGAVVVDDGVLDAICGKVR
ncbi:hypothetical protein FEK35_15190 [Nocardia cyriacigeorgica]|uniref:Uncharacterized protein n=1 Tax=Nocardia cyriacigeorgica TaxID=135487 RepID=A0A5R8PCR2_9NOCA|nr:hypothetical protein [Nocardia cyriacigeorgica]TLG09465.1 hypothetical protein FEK35_15190 [Nocardia cyriacigeorgica]